MSSTVHLTHSAAEGTLSGGDTYPYREIFKAHGWRWSRRLGAWYLAHSRDREPKAGVIDATRAALEEQGANVLVEIDETPRNVAEREADRAERLEARQAALESKADRKAAEAERLRAGAEAAVEHIPLGQPILVGHHSERRHRRDLDRFRRGTEKSLRTQREAQDTHDRASRSKRAQADRASGPATLRRIERLRTEMRDIERRVNGTSQAMGYQKAGGDYARHLEQRKAQITEEIAYWEAHLAEIGYRPFGPSDFAEGDRVRLGWGLATVERVSAKSLTVRSDVMPEIPARVEYSKVLAKESAPPAAHGRDD